MLYFVRDTYELTHTRTFFGNVLYVRTYTSHKPIRFSTMLIKYVLMKMFENAVVCFFFNFFLLILYFARALFLLYFSFSSIWCYKKRSVKLILFFFFIERKRNLPHDEWLLFSLRYFVIFWFIWNKRTKIEHSTFYRDVWPILSQWTSHPCLWTFAFWRCNGSNANKIVIRTIYRRNYEEH